MNNDSNVLVFRGDTAVADVYVADFMRMFEHYWFRSRKDEKLEAHQVFALRTPTAGRRSTSPRERAISATAWRSWA